MSEPKPTRPPQVTVAAWLVVGGSVLVVLMAFSQVAGLQSLETRESIQDYLSRPPGDALGIGVQGVLSFLRIASMVAAACAAATAILGWQVLQRSKGARVALSALAVPLLLAGLVSGGVASAVVVAAIVMLWFQPARDWFEGRTPAPREQPARPPREPAARVVAVPPPAAGGRDPLLDLPPPAGPPLHPTPYAAGTPTTASAEARPVAVRWACGLTWGFAGVAFAVLVLTFLIMLAEPNTLVDEVRKQNPDLADQGITDAVMRTTVYATSLVVILWSALAMGLAVLAWRRVRWASIGLAVSAGLAGAVCLVVVVGSVLMVVPVIACAATVTLLLRPEVRRWYAAERR